MPATTQDDGSKVVNTELNYYREPELGGHLSVYSGTAGYYRRKFDVHPARVHDIRGREQQFSLQIQGFQYHRHTSVEKDFADDSRIREIVYPETENLLREVTGATRVHVFSHSLRNDSREKVEKAVATDPSLADDDTKVNFMTPARFVHIDQSEQGAVKVLQDNIQPAELAQQLTQTRWAIINCWRPIKPVTRDPLAICDARSFRDEDLMPIQVLFPPKDSGQRYSAITKGEGFEVIYGRYHPGHEWYYANRMAPGEALFIKCYDSIRDGKTARRAVHSAFVDPDDTDETTRESIEIRCLVFFEDQPLEGPMK